MSSIDLMNVEEMIEENTVRLKSGLVKKSDFSSGTRAPNKAVDLKRAGDLAGANRLYVRFVVQNPSALFDSEFIWGWAKLFILAKEWESLECLLHYHYDIMVVWNRIMREEGNVNFFKNYQYCGIAPHFSFEEFEAGEYLRDQVHDPLDSAGEAAARLAQFGGSDLWKSEYRLSEREYLEFLRVFPDPEEEAHFSVAKSGSATTAAGSSCLLSALMMLVTAGAVAVLVCSVF